MSSRPTCPSAVHATRERHASANHRGSAAMCGASSLSPPATSLAETRRVSYPSRWNCSSGFICVINGFSDPPSPAPTPHRLRRPHQLLSWPMNKILGLTRYAVVVPALAAILGALLLMAQGSIAMVIVVISAVTNESTLKDTIVDVLTAVDAILLGTVLLVIGYGLYELFIDAEVDVPLWLRVRDLDDLKSKLIGVVVAIIAVVFVGVFVDSNRAEDVISYGVGAGAIVLGLAIFAYASKKGGSSSQ